MKAGGAYSHYAVTFLVLVSIAVFFTPPSRAQLPVIDNNGSLESPFAKVFEKAAPSIVLIKIKGEVRQDEDENEPPWFYFRREDDNGSRPYSGMGSGVIVDRNGHILTNNHVITKPDRSSVADEIIVVFDDNEEYEAEVVGRDPDSDLAVVKLKLDGKQLSPEYVADLGDSEALAPGDYAIAIGNPLGLERTITVGVISAVGRYKGINPRGANIQFKNFIQTDALINPGNSGGALLDINGRVIGINDMYIADAGIGFAIPINLAKSVMDQIIATGSVKRGAVGIQIADVNRDSQEKLDLPDREGVLVMDVLPGTPADKAGLEQNDVIVSLNGEKMKNSNEFQLKVGSLPPGVAIEIGVLHEGEMKKLTLELADRNAMLLNGEDVEWRGIHAVDIDASQAENFDTEEIEYGVVIVQIDEGSPAEDTTLQPGDVIVEINNAQIRDTEDFTKIMETNKDSKKPILIYRLRKQPNGRIIKGFVAVKSK